jgi:hypothetical protein
MKLAHGALLALLLVLPLSAADGFVGTWKMRPSGAPGTQTTQVQTITQVGDAVKVDVDIDMGNGTKMSMTYTMKLDGTEVPVYSGGKVVMMMGAKRTGSNVWEGSMSNNGTTTQFKTTLSADGKVLTSESTSGSMKLRSVFDRVK